MVVNFSLPLRPPYESFRLIFCVPLHFFSGSGSSTIFLNTCPSFLFLTRPYHFIAFLCDHCHWCHFYSSITCLFLNLSSLITPHIHLTSSFMIYKMKSVKHKLIHGTLCNYRANTLSLQLSRVVLTSVHSASNDSYQNREYPDCTLLVTLTDIIVIIVSTRCVH